MLCEPSQHLLKVLRHGFAETGRVLQLAGFGAVLGQPPLEGPMRRLLLSLFCAVFLTGPVSAQAPVSSQDTLAYTTASIRLREKPYANARALAAFPATNRTSEPCPAGKPWSIPRVAACSNAGAPDVQPHRLNGSSTLTGTRRFT